MAEFDQEAAAESLRQVTDAGLSNPVKDYLISWGLPQYVDKFKEQCIDMESLQMLSAEDIKELVPVIGHRAKLVSQLAMLKDIITDAYPSSKTMHEATTDTDSNNLNLFDTGIEYDSSKEEQQLTEISNEDLQQPNEDCELYKILSSCNEGKGLLLRHQEDGLLNNTSRRRLCNIIINNMLKDDPDRKISSARFYQLSYEITKVFKKESASIYFIPFTKFSPNQKIAAKGKLLDCFRQKRRDFIKSGVVKTKEKRWSSDSSNESGSPRPGTSFSTQAEGLLQLKNNEESDTSEKMLWLKNCCDPWETVEKYWNITTKTRLSLLQSDKITIREYYSEFKALNQAGGIFLLLKDFKTLYPSHDQKLMENWLMIRPKILEVAKKKNIFKEKMADLEHGNDETLDLAAFLSIPFLMTTSNVASKSKSKIKRMWRPSKQEVSEGFITLVKTSAEIEETIERRINKISDFDLTLQPFIIIVRPIGKTVSARYIVVNNVRYEVTSVMNAVDSCFKIIFVLNAQYPAECINVWQFIQTALFQVKTKYDTIYTTVNTLITDLNIQRE